MAGERTAQGDESAGRRQAARVGGSMSRWVALVGLLAAFLGPAALAQEGFSGTMTGPGAAEAVSATLEVEKVLLREDLVRHEKFAEDRAQSSTRLAELYSGVEAALKRDDAAAPQVLEDLMAQLDAAEREREEHLVAERALLERVRDRMRRIDLLEERLGSLQARATEAAGPLTGRWDVVLLPLNQRGTFSLLQTGTLVSGTYSLQGGWTGSLQGTLVNRKVFLERIDSKLGRSAEFEGYLASDGSQIRGEWLSYDVSGEGGATGQWSAVRRPASP